MCVLVKADLARECARIYVGVCALRTLSPYSRCRESAPYFIMANLTLYFSPLTTFRPIITFMNSEAN